ncbi:MAG: SdrD B-like domain-containing protein [Luteolibacter sp.]
MAALFVAGAESIQAATEDGALKMEVITAYNFVVDSNVETPASYSPSAAHLGVKIRNTGATTLTNVTVNIGDLINPLTSSGTPGTFPSRTVTVSGSSGYSGTFALQMPGGAVDAVRTIPSLAPGESVVQYFFVTYPLKDPSGNSVAGAAPVTSDDLWLNYDVWATAHEGATTRRVDQTTKVTMRNEISAMANKIWPNTTSKVPDKYLDAIEQTLGWRPDTTTPRSGIATQLEGIWYDLGNVGAGFDNNGDGIPDRNAWLQPVGDPTKYDPLGMRLVKCYGLVIVKLNDGTEQLIPFEDRLYFENLPANNTGAVGLVFYEFMPLSNGRTAAMSPYQEVASGYDNEKFNGDYGASGVALTSVPPSVAFDKTGPALVTAGNNATYTLVATNTGTSEIGIISQSLPFIFEDSIPSGLVYVAASATAANSAPGNTVNVSWSTDSGATWVTTEPAAASVTRIRWTLGSPLAAGATATVGFQANVPLSYPSMSIDNTAVIKVGPTGTLATDSVNTLLAGNNSIGDLVWKDDNRNLVKDGAEVGLANVTVSLYSDTNGNGVVDAGEPLYATTLTNASGAYLFSSLLDGNYVAVVDINDSDITTGYTLPLSVLASKAASLDPLHASSTAVNLLTLDWPFIPALEIVKSVSPSTYADGDLVTFNIDLENYASPVPAAAPATQTVYAAGATSKNTPELPANIVGSPNGTYGSLDWRANADQLTTTGAFTLNANTGTISKVELLLHCYTTKPFVNDGIDLSLGVSGVTPAVFTVGGVAPFTTAALNNLVGVPQDVVVNITSKVAGTWTIAQVQSLVVDLKAAKVSNSDDSLFYLDSVGVRVTAAGTPSGTYGPSSISPLPLRDTYDSTKLQYVSATVAPSSSSTAIPTAATLDWNNLGPLNPGARRSIAVTFRALSPGDVAAPIGQRDTISTINTASATNAYFVSGRRTADDSSQASITIQPKGSIGDFVFWDVNANGSFDAGDVALPRVLVYLDQLVSGSYVLGTGATFTDSSGAYLFTGLADGTYRVRIVTDSADAAFSLPWTTFTTTSTPTGGGTAASPTAVVGPNIILNNADSLTTNDSNLVQDFGFDSNVASIISGKLFNDTNANGVQDTGEIALVGQTMTLSGAASKTTTTDANGYYEFTNLTTAGSYTVTVTSPPAGSTQTLDPDGVLNSTTTFTVALGTRYPNKDFAYRSSGSLSIGDTVYVDWNGNGSQDAGVDEGIPNVDVFLYRDVNGDGLIDPATDALRATAVTDANGAYSFTGLAANSYIVVVNTGDPQFPANVFQTQDYDGTRDNQAVVTLVSTNITTADFGYKPQGTASIGDTVFLDADGDGVKDSIETGIANVLVTLYEDANNNNVVDAADAVIATATTNSSGSYLFSGLAAGKYLVDVDQASASIPSDANGNKYRLTTADPQSVTLTTGQTYLLADFGFAAGATIGDMVFFDANGNATQDVSETGIPNVTVQLFLDANQDGVADSPTPIATTTTSVGSSTIPVGYYQFTNLAAGTYFVKVLTTTLPQVSGQPIPLTADPDRDGVPVLDNTYPLLPAGDNADSLVIVSLGGNYTGADFGYKPPGSVGDFVWLDLDQDGVQDAGEPGIANVTITLTSSGGGSFTTTTDSDGHWSYANLANTVTWTVTATGTALNGTLPTYDAQGAVDSSASFVLTNGVVNLAAGNLGIDFGYKLNGSYSISGTVATHDTRVVGTADDVDDFYDDGVDQDAGPLDEIELSGITVYLYTTGGNFLGTTTTDAHGNYSFSGLPGGTYRVIIGTTTPALLNSTLTTTAANNPAVSSVDSSSGTTVIQTLTVASSNVTNVDFTFLSNLNYDYGDLPLSYGMTTLGQDGARHIIPGGGSTVYLGTAPDADTNGVPSSLANGDDSLGSDDESGITPLSVATWVNGTNGGSIQANVTGSGWLVGWIDWNHDGDFLDPGEFVVSRAVTTGTTTVSFDIPAGTIGAASESWLSRFRIFTAEPDYPLFSYTGVATDGEVEDYLIEKPVGASIGDLVWNDANANGALDASEDGFGGLTVVLRNNSNTIVGTQTTGTGLTDVDGDGVIDPLGYYRFQGLAAGTYTVTVTPPAGFNPSYDENGTGTANVTSVTVVASESHLTADFGYAPLRANISGQVRYDTNANGNFSDPDSGAPGIKIQLWTDPNGDGNPADGEQVSETYTGGTGNYLFTSVPTGKYTVVEINSPGSTSTADVYGANDDRIAVVMTGTNVTGRDFLDTMPPVYSISGTVYDDAPSNDNVIGAGDAPIASVTVKLFFDRDANGVVSDGDSELSSTVTNASGAYSFSALPVGNYIVQEINPAGATDDWDAQGSPTDNQIAVALVNADVTARNFLDDGYLGTIGNLVWLDENHNGLVDSGEPGLSGITVSLYGSSQTPGVDAPVASTVTNGSGIYGFANVVPGDYKIYLPVPPAASPGLSDVNNTGDNQIDNDNNGIQSVIGGPVTSPVITISAGENDATIDFAFNCQGTWDEWKLLNPLGGQNQSGDNPDGDDYDNLVEFAFNMPATSGAGDPYCIRPSSTNPGTIEAVFTRPEGATQNVVYSLQYASTLGATTTWTTILLTPAMITVVEEGNCIESVTINDLETLTGLTAGKGFVRIRAELDEVPPTGTDHTSYTQVTGWTETALGICCRTYNNPYLHCADFTGTVSAVVGQTLTFTTSAGTVDLGTLLTPGAAYFLEVTSGDNEGHRFDVVSASGNVVTLATDTDLAAVTPPFNTLAGALPATLAGDHVVIRRHWTLGEQFPVTGFFAAGTHTLADQVQTFADGAWTTYWLYDNGGSPKWVKGGDGTMADQAATVLPPGQGTFVLRRNTATAILAYGDVRKNTFINPLPAGTSLTGGGYPLDQSATGTGSRQISLAAGFFGSRDFKTADSFFIWKGDAAPGTSGYDTYYLLYRDTVFPAQIKWVKVGDASLASRDAARLLLGDSSVFLRVKNDMPAYSIPSPWNP